MPAKLETVKFKGPKKLTMDFKMSPNVLLSQMKRKHLDLGLALLINLLLYKLPAWNLFPSTYTDGIVTGKGFPDKK